MNAPPANSDLLQRLAADYVLGTMRGAARRRLARWRSGSAELDGYCIFWEERLMPLMHRLEPMKPPPAVWPRIQARLAIRPASRERARLRLLAWAASVLLIAAGGIVFYWLRFGAAPAIESATISARGGGPIWDIRIVGRLEASERLAIRTGRGASPPAGRAYELWALPKNAMPVSLGVLPVVEGSTVRSLTPTQRQALALAENVAVSIEPPGGSPTGQPTGAIAFVAPLSRAT